MTLQQEFTGVVMALINKAGWPRVGELRIARKLGNRRSNPKQANELARLELSMNNGSPRMRLA